MTMTDTHALGGAYVLDAVSETERAAFERHLTGCETCSTEIAELRETAARLTDATWAVPPPALREQVLTRVRQTRQEPPRLPATPGPPTRWRRRSLLAAAAAALLAAGSLGGHLTQQPRIDQQRHAAQAARDRAAAIEAVLSAPDVRLHTAATPSGSRLTAAVSSSRDQAVLFTPDLPTAGPNRVHQVWLVEGTLPTSAGLLPADRSDRPLLINAVRGMDVLAVTVEPAGGSPAPSTPPVARLRLD